MKTIALLALGAALGFGVTFGHHLFKPATLQDAIAACSSPGADFIEKSTVSTVVQLHHINQGHTYDEIVAACRAKAP